MKEVKPDLVIGCGGYVSGPVVRCAAKMASTPPFMSRTPSPA